ncbi:MFS transporter [Variovorax saccharolyticus]|uniref:MFS transporter n=1 Tax=Variovorax saccharolyticus TaxID=3053516 RepID=UPI0025772F4F|nr:MFS transporter [Variovorax sp. J31P216]MDM0026526.1 MFS transporter [Variovorax sp. J31P216]
MTTSTAGSAVSFVPPAPPRADTTPMQPTISRKAVAAAIAGNALEFYDFVLYAYFAIYIGQTFFPVAGEFGSLLASVATFGVGFFTRPLGSVLIGAFADRVGRKPALILTVVLITLGTLGIAATPGYATIGIAAPIIVVVCRLLQGLALGGEVGPATALLLEMAPPGKRAFYTSWQLASQGLAVAVGGLFGVIVSSSLSPQDLASWGWRLPFLFSLVLVPIAVYIRRSLPETLGHNEGASTAQIVGKVFGQQRRWVVLGVLMMMATVVSSQFGNFMATYAIKALKLPPAVAQSSVLLAGLLTFGGALFAGWLCDRHGRKALMLLPRVALALAIVPMLVGLHSAPTAGTLFVVVGILALLTAMSGAASLVVVPELIPIAIRSTTLSLVYAIAATVFGGTTQLVVTWLMAVTGDPVSPAWYIVATSVISLIAMAMLPETRDVDVTK